METTEVHFIHSAGMPTADNQLSYHTFNTAVSKPAKAHVAFDVKTLCPCESSTSEKLFLSATYNIKLVHFDHHYAAAALDIAHVHYTSL